MNEFKPTRHQTNRAKYLANAVIGNAIAAQKLADYGHPDLAEVMAKNARAEAERAFDLAKRVAEGK